MTKITTVKDIENLDTENQVRRTFPGNPLINPSFRVGLDKYLNELVKKIVREELNNSKPNKPTKWKRFTDWIGKILGFMLITFLFLLVIYGITWAWKGIFG